MREKRPTQLRSARRSNQIVKPLEASDLHVKEKNHKRIKSMYVPKTL